MAEYPIYVKALIKRQRGEINESLQLFQAATCLNPHNIANLKQVGRSLYLLARHKAALDVYEEALRIGVDDWEIWHNKGLCNMYLKQYDASADCFKRANSIQRHDTTYMQLGKVYTLQEDYRTAIDVYLEVRLHDRRRAAPCSPRPAALARDLLSSSRLPPPLRLSHVVLTRGATHTPLRPSSSRRRTPSC